MDTTALFDTIDNWSQRHPQTVAFFNLLNKQGVDWGIYCGAAVNLLTGNRPLNDIDIVIREDDFQAVCRLAPTDATIYSDATATVVCGDGVVLDFPRRSVCFWLDNHEIEIMASTTARYGNHHYHLAMDDLVVKNRLVFEVSKTQLYVTNPFDTIALKSILQRSHRQGKHDAIDLASLAKHCSLNTHYTLRRAREIQLNKRALDFLARCNIDFTPTPVQTTPTYDILYV